MRSICLSASPAPRAPALSSDSSRERRERTSANSAPTKKPLTATRAATAARRTAVTGSAGGPRGDFSVHRACTVAPRAKERRCISPTRRDPRNARLRPARRLLDRLEQPFQLARPRDQLRELGGRPLKLLGSLPLRPCRLLGKGLVRLLAPCRQSGTARGEDLPDQHAEHDGYQRDARG